MHMHMISFNWKMDTVHLILSNLWGVRPYKPASKYSYLCKFPFPLIPSLSKKYNFIYNVLMSFYPETPYSWAVQLLTEENFLQTPKYLCFYTYYQCWNGNSFHVYPRFKFYFKILAVKGKKFRWTPLPRLLTMG